MTGAVDAYPLTPSQLGILVDTQRDPDPELYFEQVRLDLVGPVDPDRLHDAWCRTVEHHPALRTAWLWEGLDQPVQVVREHVDLPWTVLDRRGVVVDRDALDQLATDDRARGFDLRRPPVMRVTVVRLADDRVHLIWSFHHIVMDGWSTARVLDEVLARHDGTTVPRAPAFREHVAWLQRQDSAASDRHWRRLIGGFDHPNELVGMRSDGSGPFRRATHRVCLDDDETGRLAAVAREHRVTVNTLVQAAWAMTLSCYSGDADVAFGVTGSGRPADIPDVESIVGMFLATLPMRVQLGHRQTVVDLWRSVQSQQLDLTQFQYSSLAEVTRMSDVPAGAPMFHTALVFENFPRPDTGARALAIEHHDVFEQTRFALTVMVGLSDRLELLALFDEGRLERPTVERVLDGFRQVLRASVADPTAEASSVDPVPADERRRLLADVNDTTRPVDDTTVHAEIAAHGVRAPDDVAILDRGRAVTYGELRDDAERARARLADAGVEVGDVVVIACERSADAVAAALGAMASGAAYLAVGSTAPTERLRTIIEDAAPTLAVVTAGTAGGFDDLDVAAVDVTDLLRPTPADAAGPEPAPVGPDDTMFVVFTSGSTGRPKGVPGSHRAVLNRCAWEREVAPFEPGEVVCQKTTFDFVDHVAELWGPLVAGRTVLIVGDDVVRDPPALVAALSSPGVRRVVLVPSLLEVLLDTVPDLAARLPELRRWTLSGERLPTELAARFHETMPHARLINVYGMSEVMADATAFESTPDAMGSASAPTVPIGRPLRNQRVYVLDGLRRPAPVGVSGEIWVSGVGLMHGYWRRDDLTGERVEPNPLGDGAHARRYATGDVGRWNADGQLEYLGRRDRQVKVRGHRVELGDSEAVLRRLPGVRDAVVVDVAEPGRPTRLVGFVVAVDDAVPLDVNDLRRRAVGAAPAALVPEQLVVVDRIPLLPSGKIDHRALAQRRPDPAPVEIRADTRAGNRADTALDDDTTEMLSIWRDVIGNADIGPDDDFFDAGGHSIDGMRVLAGIARRYDVNLALSVLYTDTTPRQLLARVRRARRGGDHGADVDGHDEFRHLVPISQGADDRRMMYCVHGAGGNVLNFRDLANALAPDWGMTGIQASGIDGVRPLHRTMSEMCDAYIAEITDDRGEMPLFLAGFSGGGIVAFEIAVRLRDLGRPPHAVILFDTFHPSFRARRRSVGEHTAALLRQGPAYLLERQRVRRQRRLYRDADAVETSADGPIPHELRDAVLVNNTLSIFDRHESRSYDGEVWMYAAAEIADVLDHAGPDRGWAPFAPRLRCTDVPGSHHDFLLEPHVERLAAILRSDLESALEGNDP